MPRKVLIVDDALVDRQSMERIVLDAGHLAVLAESGEQAIQRAQKDKPDVILMDVNMPGMDGFAATRALKADAATKDIPIVFVTSKNQKADIAWGQMLGAKGYIAKPFTREQILEAVNA